MSWQCWGAGLDTRSGAVPTLTDVLREQTTLAPEQAEWLHLLVGDWQLLSDLSFADLVLWVPVRAGRLAGGRARAPDHRRDGVLRRPGRAGGSSPGRRPQLDQAYAGARIVRAAEPECRDDMPVREEAIPVVRDGRAARRAHPAYQPGDHAHAEPAGADLRRPRPTRWRG